MTSSMGGTSTLSAIVALLIVGGFTSFRGMETPQNTILSSDWMISAGPDGSQSMRSSPSKNSSTISDTVHSCSKHNGPMQISTTAFP